MGVRGGGGHFLTAMTQPERRSTYLETLPPAPSPGRGTPRPLFDAYAPRLTTHPLSLPLPVFPPPLPPPLSYLHLPGGGGEEEGIGD